MAFKVYLVANYRYVDLGQRFFMELSHPLLALLEALAVSNIEYHTGSNCIPNQ